MHPQHSGYHLRATIPNSNLYLLSGPQTHVAISLSSPLTCQTGEIVLNSFIFPPSILILLLFHCPSITSFQLLRRAIWQVPYCHILSFSVLCRLLKYILIFPLISFSLPSLSASHFHFLPEPLQQLSNSSVHSLTPYNSSQSIHSDLKLYIGTCQPLAQNPSVASIAPRIKFQNS